MTYQAILFDLDGTLVGTKREYRYLAVETVLRKLGIAPEKIDRSSVERFWFEASREEVIVGEFRVSVLDFWETFRQTEDYLQRIKYTEAYPDVSFLKELKERGYQTGIVTGAPEHIAIEEIALLGEEPVKEIVYALGNNGIPRKPSPQGLQQCLEKLKVRPEEAMYVGNANEDVMAARNAGMLDVLIDRGDYQFLGLEASFRIESLYELRKLL